MSRFEQIVREIEEVSELTEQQKKEIARIKAYYPFRICFGSLSPSGEFETWALTNRRRINKLVRSGYRVWEVR